MPLPERNRDDRPIYEPETDDDAQFQEWKTRSVPDRDGPDGGATGR